MNDAVLKHKTRKSKMKNSLKLGLEKFVNSHSTKSDLSTQL